MKDTVYLSFDAAGIRGMRKSRPHLHAGEYAIRVVIDVPQAAFAKELPTVFLDVDPAQVIAGISVSVEQDTPDEVSASTDASA